MYISTTYRTVCRKIQRCFRFKYLKFKKSHTIDANIVLKSSPLVSDIVTDHLNNEGKFNIIQFTESHIESVLFTYFLYRSLGYILNSTTLQHIDID